jgi:hypothetical protein
VAAAGQRLRQMWSRLGTIDRKEKRKLDQTFDKVLAGMLAPLSEQRKIEASKREQLIVEAEALDPSDRHTLDQLRRLQERWQEQAKALPLERKVEQALWQRFRAACDAIFAKRKESAHAADHERKAHLHAREAICKELEEPPSAATTRPSWPPSPDAEGCRRAWQPPAPCRARRAAHQPALSERGRQGAGPGRRDQARWRRPGQRAARQAACASAESASVTDGAPSTPPSGKPVGGAAVAGQRLRALQGRFNAALAAVDGSAALRAGTGTQPRQAAG